MRCADLMSTEPITVDQTENVSAAVDILMREKSLNLPVVDGDGRYVGMFGTDDLLGLIVPRVAIAGNLAPNLRFVDEPGPLAERFRDQKQRSVGEVADKNAVALAPDTPAMEAFRIFCRRQGSLPVVDPANHKLVGIVSYWDVMGAVSDGL